MGFEFKIVQTDRENLLDGDYVAVIRSMEEKTDKYGDYILVEEELLSPVDVQGRIEYERFYIGSYEQIKKERAVEQFSIFCKQLSTLKDGDVLKSEHLIGKKFIKTIKNNTANNGKVYANTVGRLLIEDSIDRASAIQTVLYGKIAIPKAEATGEWPIEDEVPF